MSRYFYERPIKVIQTCDREWISEQDVEVLDICEGPMGEDILTFVCPTCGETHKSKRFG